MIPLEDESRRPSQLPLVTISIIALNAIVFVLELMGGDAFVLRWSAVPAQILAGHHWETLLTSMFLHGSWSHIIGNMIYLWAFGPEMEDAMGSRRYAAFYLLGGIASMAAQLVFDPHSHVPFLGASGAIAAVMGAFLVTYPGDRIRTVLFFGIFFRIAFIPAVLLIGFWFVLQLVDLGAVGPAETGGVAYMAHVAGMLFGALTGRLFEAGRARRGGLSYG